MTSLRGWTLFAVLALTACDQPQGPIAIRSAEPRSSLEQEIQGGTRDNTSSNVVAIIFDTGQGAGICSGSLIAPNLVLTARHCVASSGAISCSGASFGTTFAASAFRVTTSPTAAATVFSTGQWPFVDNSTWFAVNQVSVPTTPANSICGGDMALLRLSTNITNICPLIPRVDAPVVLNEGYTAVGFGVLSPTGQTSGTRYTVGGLNVFCTSNCGPDFHPTIEWFGGSQTALRGVCEGDSGGPALDSQRRILGTVSRGSAGSCQQAIYAGVFGQSAWIKSVATAAATAGGYTAPAWVTGGTTNYNPCPGAIDGGTMGTGGGAGGGGGTATGGGGGTTGGTCSGTNVCRDVTGGANFACVTSAGGIPSGVPSCATSACPTGFSCYATATSRICLQDCSATGAGGGGGTAAGGGGGTATGGGGGTTAGPCTVASTTCVDASGLGNYACIANTTTGIPASAPACSATIACPAGFNCWRATGGNYCLQDCSPTAPPAGGGTGTTGGGTGTTGGGTGTTGGGTGATGGGTGTTGGGTGTTGGGTGTTGGGAGATGGGGGATGGGTGTPPIVYQNASPARQMAVTGCGCSGLPEGTSALWLAVAGLVFTRRRAR